MGATLMVQGTASYVGKSVLVAALCRAFLQEGLRVAPFKAQNMALNSFVTAEGGEIGRSQAFQAEAAGVEPTVDMNPILLKPAAGMGAQVIVRGKALAHMKPSEYHTYQAAALEVISASLSRLRAQYDLVVLEGAGSPAEVNLRDRDIANMRIAQLAQAPVLLVGDIDRGGVFASLVGTVELLLPEERKLVRGLVINKFRGDARELEPGLRFLHQRTGAPVLGVLPFYPDLQVDEEDAVALEDPSPPRGRGPSPPPPFFVDIVVIQLPHISNFTDFDPLTREAGVRLRYVDSVGALGDPDVVILPGSKATIADLRWLREAGLSDAVLEHAQRDKEVVGICGGYQMLGKEIRDPERVESPEQSIEGLRLLDVVTTFGRDKVLTQVGGDCFAEGWRGRKVRGYEIHQGQTQRGSGCAPVFHLTERLGRAIDEMDGAMDRRGKVWGTYLHGVFDSEDFRQAWLAPRRPQGWAATADAASSSLSPGGRKEATFNRLAEMVRTHLDWEALKAIAGGR